MTNNTYKSKNQQTSTDHEYRVVGVTPTGWRRTEWTDYEAALEDYKTAKSEWDGYALERRKPDNNKSIQRKPSPNSDGWTDVTDEMTHFVDEEVRQT